MITLCAETVRRSLELLEAATPDELAAARLPHPLDRMRAEHKWELAQERAAKAARAAEAAGV